MKSENKSWKDIALEVGASKKDVQNRFKELMKSSSSNSGDGEKKDEGGNNGWDTASNGWATVVDDSGAGMDGDRNGNMPDFSTLFDDVDNGDNKDDGGERTEGKNGWDVCNNGGNNWGNSRGGVREKKQEGGWDTTGNNGGNNNCGNSGTVDESKKQKGGKNKTQQNGGSQNSNGGKNWSSSSNNNSSSSNHKKNRSSNSGYSNPFSDRHAISDSDPEPQKESGKGRLRPDGIWTQDDCEVLEWLESKYEENKWLHMQAGFYNWTGRMVIAELIQKKFKDDGAA